MKDDVRWNDRWLIENAKLMPQCDPEKWAYTQSFDSYAAEYRNSTGQQVDNSEIFQRVIYLRKCRYKMSMKGLRFPPMKGKPPSYLKVPEEYLPKLIALYDAQSLPTEKLPYSTEMFLICEELLNAWVPGRTDWKDVEYGIWRNLINLRRQGKLKRKKVHSDNKRHAKKNLGKGFGLIAGEK